MGQYPLPRDITRLPWIEEALVYEKRRHDMARKAATRKLIEPHKGDKR
jgi:hypothetical protein